MEDFEKLSDEAVKHRELVEWELVEGAALSDL
jgi:hypothetical protein